MIFEDAQLSRAIISHGAITIEMVGSEVEPETDGRVKAADTFKLKRAHFNRKHVEWLLLARHFGKRFANISASDCSLTASIHHLSERFGRCCLAVRAGNSDDRNFAELPT